MQVTFQSHIRFARKVQKYGDAFSKSSSIEFLSSLAIILTRKGVLVAVNVLWPFLTVPWVGLQLVIVFIEYN